LTQSILFSTGSSSVIIFTSIEFRLTKHEYNVVDFQLHVGQLVNIIPFGSDIAFSKISLFFHSIHNKFNVGIFLLLSTIRITIFSQFTVGKVEILRSSGFSSIIVDILQS